MSASAVPRPPIVVPITISFGERRVFLSVLLFDEICSSDESRGENIEKKRRERDTDGDCLVIGDESNGDAASKGRDGDGEREYGREEKREERREEKSEEKREERREYARSEREIFLPKYVQKVRFCDTFDNLRMSHSHSNTHTHTHTRRRFVWCHDIRDLIFSDLCSWTSMRRTFLMNLSLHLWRSHTHTHIHTHAHTLSLVP